MKFKVKLFAAVAALAAALALAAAFSFGRSSDAWKVVEQKSVTGQTASTTGMDFVQRACHDPRSGRITVQILEAAR